MAQISGNSCKIITLSPMEVECNVTNSSTPTSTNGSVQLLINGGTAPYSISWSNGQQGQTLTGLLPGTYSATVTDYYGDYTVTTECVVDYDSFYLDKLLECDEFTNSIYIEQGNTFNPSLIYSFNEIEGCYQFDGTELWTGQTYSAVTINSPYNNCIECQPVTPNPPIQPDLCLSDGTTQYTFTSNGTDSNGNYTWTNSTYSLTMNYNTTIQRWEILNWSTIGNGTMGFNQNPPSIPLGSWINYGVSIENDWLVTQGICETITLSINSNTSDPSCVGDTGSVTLIGNGGTPPYQYIIPGVTSSLQNSGIFTNLSSGTYNGTVQDANSNTATTSFTIGVGVNAVTYSMNITTSNLQTIPGTNTVTKSYNYNIGVSPSLPLGTSISFILRLSHTQERGGIINGNGSGDITFTNNFVINKNNVPVTTSNSTINTTTGIVCGESIKYIDSYETNSVSITVNSGDVINGSVSQTTTLINLINNCNCKTYGDYDTSLQIINPTILNENSCETITPIVTPILTETYIEGCQTVINCNTYSAVNLGEDEIGAISFINCNGVTQNQNISRNSAITFCARPIPAPSVILGQGITITQISTVCS